MTTLNIPAQNVDFSKEETGKSAPSFVQMITKTTTFELCIT